MGRASLAIISGSSNNTIGEYFMQVPGYPNIHFTNITSVEVYFLNNGSAVGQGSSEKNSRSKHDFFFTGRYDYHDQFSLPIGLDVTQYTFRQLRSIEGHLRELFGSCYMVLDDDQYCGGVLDINQKCTICHNMSPQKRTMAEIITRAKNIFR